MSNYLYSTHNPIDTNLVTGQATYYGQPISGVGQGSYTQPDNFYLSPQVTAFNNGAYQYVQSQRANDSMWMGQNIRNHEAEDMVRNMGFNDAVLLAAGAQPSLGGGGWDAIYGDGYSEAFALRLQGQLSPSNPHYNTILLQEEAREQMYTQEQQIYQPQIDRMWHQGIAPIENFALNSSSNSEFIAGLNAWNYGGNVPSQYDFGEQTMDIGKAIAGF